MFKKFIVIVFVCFLGWQIYHKYLQPYAIGNLNKEILQVSKNKPNSQKKATQFQCDGRVYCSQMNSCSEAMFFLQNCPGTKMDGNDDGVPCEKQWCK
jgi:hypothetical protein